MKSIASGLGSLGGAYANPLFKVDEESLKMSVHLIPREQIVKDLLEAFHRDTEGKIRQALIDMGWTPPPVADDFKEAT